MQNQTLKVYRDGKLDRWATYGPVVYERLAVFGNKVDYWFRTSGRWPTDQDLVQ